MGVDPLFLGGLRITSLFAIEFKLLVLPERVNFKFIFCQAPRLSSELEFVRALISIGKKLGAQPTKEAKTSRLLAELSVLNLNLPARVYLPLNAIEEPHHIVRIPPQAAVVLNSKDKVIRINQNTKLSSKLYPINMS